ncbi:MAG: winged helix-turn-helix transcriptional regulator [Alphaproteobacteria bacterium]|nr:winged helix-turn-helix transcriptional regulator [Alphaproteobacteria bacterium]
MEVNAFPLSFNPEATDKAREITRVLKALAHKHRLMIMCLLVDGAKSVNELEKLLCLRQSAVSQQLARLRAARLVGTQRQGKMVYYFIEGEETLSTVKFLCATYFR